MTRHRTATWTLVAAVVAAGSYAAISAQKVSEPTLTADGMGAILRSPGAPPWNFRCRGAILSVEESLHVDGRGVPVTGQQLVVVGETSGVGCDIGWMLRRSS